VSDVLPRFGEHTACAVVDADGVFLGRFRMSEAEARAHFLARDLMSPGASTFRPDVHVSEMAEWFEKRPKADHFFITRPNGAVVGILYRSAVEHFVEHATRES
jgi:hypothetical protein